MTISFVNKGTFDSGQNTLAPGIPASMQAGDFMLLVIETANEAISSVSGWTEITNSPQGTGTAATAGGVRVCVFYRWWQSGDAAPTVPDSGNHQTAIIVGFRGVHASTPFDNTPVGGVQASASSSWTLPSITTQRNNSWIVYAIANDRDLASTSNLSGVTNANLSSITIQHDQTVSTLVGGGVGVITATKASAGSTGTTAVTNGASNTAAWITIALRDIAWQETVGSSSGTATNSGIPSIDYGTLQVLRPYLDDSNTGGWSPTNSATFYEALNETLPDTTTLMSTTTDATVIVRLVTNMLDPTVNTNHVVIFYFYTSDATVILTVTLVQGTTDIESKAVTIADVVNNTVTPIIWTLSSTNVANITNYADLRLKFQASYGGG